MILAGLTALALTQDSVDLNALFRSIDASRMRATIEKLSSWNTRNTSSAELTEAVNWVADQYRKLPGMQVEVMTYTVEPGPRVPAEKQVVEVVAKLPGDDDEMVLLGGHLDSINMQRQSPTDPLPDPLTARAPGANDDGSGSALTLELARVMSSHKWRHTLVFCGFSGEEQGLFGSTALAKRAADEKWKINAVLSNDMVGNSSNILGQSDSKHVRLFSDPPDPTGKNPQISRELARFIEFEVRHKLPSHPVKLVLRRDRFGRAGDHTPFSEAGFNAVRFTDVFEEYSRQHTPNDLITSVDWNYLTENAKVNLTALVDLANAGPAPQNLKMDTRQGYNTILRWTATPHTRYIVYQRDTASSTWEKAYDVGEVDHVTLDKVGKDDNFFAVGAVGGVPIPATKN